MQSRAPTGQFLVLAMQDETGSQVMVPNYTSLVGVTGFGHDRALTLSSGPPSKELGPSLTKCCYYIENPQRMSNKIVPFKRVFLNYLSPTEKPKSETSTLQVWLYGSSNPVSTQLFCIFSLFLQAK